MMKNLEKKIDELIATKSVSKLAVRIGKGEKILYDTFRGGVNKETLFDMASVTKIVATTSLGLIALDKGLIHLDDPVNKFFPTDKNLTIKNLFTHTIGIGHKWIDIPGNTYDNIAQKILEIPLDIPIGTDVLYSCPGFILFAKILEKVFEMRFDVAFYEMVAKPLGMTNTQFNPKERNNIVNANIDERKLGCVNDNNCRFLGGISGNAGLFSNIIDITKYVGMLLNKGAPLFSEQTFETAVKNYTGYMSVSRALGFMYVDKRYAQTGGLFEDGAIGHCGHTGQSVFVDYRTGLYVIILSDATVSTVRKYGGERYDDVMRMRAEVHAAIKQDLGV